MCLDVSAHTLLNTKIVLSLLILRIQSCYNHNFNYLQYLIHKTYSIKWTLYPILTGTKQTYNTLDWLYMAVSTP